MSNKTSSRTGATANGTTANGAAQGGSRLQNDPLARFVTRRSQSTKPTPVQIDRQRMSQTMFRPHATRGGVRMMNKPQVPVVAFTTKALEQIGAYVGLMDKEIAWMSSVKKHNDGLYVVDECFLFGQAVHSTTAEIDPEKLGQLIHEILQERPDDGMEVVNSLKCWGHSHVNMGTSPSGQDDRQMDDFGDTVADFMVRVIANKKGDIRVCVWDYDQGLIFEDIAWTFLDAHNADRLNAVADEIEAKVTNLGFGASLGSTTGSVYTRGTAAATQDDQADFGFDDAELSADFYSDLSMIDPQDTNGMTALADAYGVPLEAVAEMLGADAYEDAPGAVSGPPQAVRVGASGGIDLDDPWADDGSYTPQTSRRVSGR